LLFSPHSHLPSALAADATAADDDDDEDDDANDDDGDDDDDDDGGVVENTGTEDAKDRNECIIVSVFTCA
jgi:hypothetical protein